MNLSNSKDTSNNSDPLPFFRLYCLRNRIQQEHIHIQYKYLSYGYIVSMRLRVRYKRNKDIFIVSVL